MKFFNFLLLFIAFSSSSQTITSVMNGNATNPLVWDCTCFPTTSSDIVINHTINLDVDWAINAGGSITVNASGQLKQVGLKDLLVDGTGSFITNNGFTQLNRIAVMNAGVLTNNDHFSITEAMYVGPGATLSNTDLMDGLDSLMTEGTSQNDGVLYVGNFLNTGAFENTGHIAADSIGNTGTFTSTSGWIQGTAIGNSGDFYLQTEGFMIASDNWWNIGNFEIDANVDLICDKDLYNGDTLGGFASLINDGTISVAKDFYNGWNLSGAGSICIAEESYNVGAITGTLDICDNTGSDFDFNTGTIAGTITHCQPGCFVEIEEIVDQLSVYPNPTEGIINIDATNVFTDFTVTNLEGKVMLSGLLSGTEIDLTFLNGGLYFLTLEGSGKLQVVSIIKN
ncbi:MAG: T9SS type A sorting domain-containing protein [Bacteroidota bacterium]